MKEYLFSIRKKKQYLLLFGDLSCIVVAILCGYFFKIYMIHNELSFHALISKVSIWALMLVFLHFLSLYSLGLYNLERLGEKSWVCFNIIISVIVVGIILSAILFFHPKYVLGRQIFLVHVFLCIVLLILWRLLIAKKILFIKNVKRIAIIGNCQTVEAFKAELAIISSNGLIVSNYCIYDESSKEETPQNGVFSETKTIDDLIYENDFDILAYDASGCPFSDIEIKKIIDLKFRGKAVYDFPTLYKNLTGKVPLTFINGRWLLSRDELKGSASNVYIKTKRLMDIFLSLFCIIVTFPFMMLIAAVIRMDSKGRVIFIQERLGFQKTRFNCYKFRTMVEGAESKTGPVWSKENDSRITRSGKFLRKTRLDELPQLFNILKGDMSFVGPRPIRDHFAKKLEEMILFYDLRFNVKPGLSGWAQVNYDYAGSNEGQREKFQYELFYIQNFSFFLDVLIIFKTIRTVLLKSGS